MNGRRRTVWLWSGQIVASSVFELSTRQQSREREGPIVLQAVSVVGFGRQAAMSREGLIMTYSVSAVGANRLQQQAQGGTFRRRSQAAASVPSSKQQHATKPAARLC